MLLGVGLKRLFSVVCVLFVDDLLEEVVIFVIDQDKCWEIFYFDFLDSFYIQFWISDVFQMFDVLLCQYCCWIVDVIEVEVVVFMICVGNLLIVVIFRQYDYVVVVGLQQIYVGVYMVCGGWVK